MAFRAGDSLLGPGAGVGVRLEVETFLILSGVAIGAVGIPVHALSGPVAPFTRDAILSLENINPAVLDDIIGSADRLEAPTREGGEVLAQGGITNDTGQFINPFQILGGIKDPEFKALIFVSQFVGDPRFNNAPWRGEGGFIQLCRDGPVGLGVVAHLPVFKNLGMAFGTGLWALCQYPRRVV